MSSQSNRQHQSSPCGKFLSLSPSLSCSLPWLIFLSIERSDFGKPGLCQCQFQRIFFLVYFVKKNDEEKKIATSNRIFSKFLSLSPDFLGPEGVLKSKQAKHTHTCWTLLKKLGSEYSIFRSVRLTKG